MENAAVDKSKLRSKVNQQISKLAIRKILRSRVWFSYSILLTLAVSYMRAILLYH